MQVWSAPPSKTPEQDFWEREKQKEFFLFSFFFFAYSLCMKIKLEGGVWRGRMRARRNTVPYAVTDYSATKGEWPGVTLCLVQALHPCLGLWVGDVRASSCCSGHGLCWHQHWSLADSRVRVKDQTVVRCSAPSQAPLCGAVENFNQILGS